MAKMFSNFFGQSQSDSELSQEETDSDEIKNTDSVSPDRLDVMEERIKVLKIGGELEAFIHKTIQDTVTVESQKLKRRKPWKSMSLIINRILLVIILQLQIQTELSVTYQRTNR